MSDTISLQEARTREAQTHKTKDLTAYNIQDFLSLNLPPREDILTPVLQAQSLSMLFAKRGIGKTHIALGIAYAVASGGRFMKWMADTPRKVLYIDGEMPARTMQERLAQIVKSNDVKAAPEYFCLLTPDMQELGMPDLSTEEGQKALEPFVNDAEFIVIDNLSTLVRSGKENEAESWQPIQDWALKMRSSGKSVLFVHHAGKGGKQRGTSRREDVLDLVIRLEHPEDYRTEQGARFEVHFDKARNLAGAESKPFEAQLTPQGWTFSEIEDVEMKRVVELKEIEGMNYREIGQELGFSKSKAQRLYDKYYTQKHSSQNLSHRLALIERDNGTDLNNMGHAQDVG